MIMDDSLQRTTVACRRRLLENPGELYWSLRFLQLTLHDHGDADHPLAADCLARLLTVDPDLFLSQSHVRLSMSFGPWLEPSVLMALEERLKLTEPEYMGPRPLVALGMLMVAARLGRSDPTLAHRAKEYLEAADGADAENQCVIDALSTALVESAPAEHEVFVTRLSTGSPSIHVDLLRSSALRKDWDIYEKHRTETSKHWSKLDAHTRCEILNYDGLSALAARDSARVQSTLLRLMEESVNVPYLDAPATLGFVASLVEMREFIAECRAYLSQIQRAGGRSPQVDLLLWRAKGD